MLEPAMASLHPNHPVLDAFRIYHRDTPPQAGTKTAGRRGVEHGRTAAAQRRRPFAVDTPKHRLLFLGM